MHLDIVRQQLNGSPQAGHGAHQGLLDAGTHSRRARKRPGGRHVHVQINKTPLTRAARGEVINADGRLLERFQRCANVGQHFRLDGFVHQAL